MFKKYSKVYPGRCNRLIQSIVWVLQSQTEKILLLCFLLFAKSDRKNLAILFFLPNINLLVVSQYLLIYSWDELAAELLKFEVDTVIGVSPLDRTFISQKLQRIALFEVVIQVFCRLLLFFWVFLFYQLATNSDFFVKVFYDLVKDILWIKEHNNS